MISQLPHLQGYLVLARPINRSSGVDTYLVMEHEKHVGTGDYLELLPTVGGIYSDSPFTVNLTNWEVLGYLANDTVIEALLESLMTVIRGSSFTFTAAARARLEKTAGDLSRLQRIIANRRDRANASPQPGPAKPDPKSSPFDDLFNKADELPLNGCEPDVGQSPKVFVAVIGPSGSETVAQDIYNALRDRLAL